MSKSSSVARSDEEAAARDLAVDDELEHGFEPEDAPALSDADLNANELDDAGLAGAVGQPSPVDELAFAVEAGDEQAAATDDSPSQAEQRIGSLGYHVWIMPHASREGLALGKLRMGTSVRLRSAAVVAGEGCGRGWRAVSPRGFVCLNRDTTLDLRQPYYRALAELAPSKTASFPYRYAHSRGAPMYSRVPTPAEWKDAEKQLGAPGTYQALGEWAKGHEELIDANAKIQPTDAVPWFFKNGHRGVRGGTRDPRRLVWKTIPNGSMLAFALAFEMHGRTWLVTPDLMLVPADRMQVMRQSRFKGIELDDETRLPIAFNRSRKPVPLYRRDPAGHWLALAERLPSKGWSMISGASERFGGARFWELRQRPGVYLKENNITISRARKKLPRAIKAGEKWIDARITPGTLTAYEGLRPVYATLFSPGKGGQPKKGLDQTKDAASQTGYFRFEWKERVATVSSDKGEPHSLWFSDVPHIQHIRPPVAMHAVYWHEDFGNKKSAESLNLSPSDGKWMFEFSDPPLPPDWSAVRPGGGNGRSTPIIINGF